MAFAQRSGRHGHRRDLVGRRMLLIGGTVFLCRVSNHQSVLSGGGWERHLPVLRRGGPCSPLFVDGSNVPDRTRCQNFTTGILLDAGVCHVQISFSTGDTFAADVQFAIMPTTTGCAPALQPDPHTLTVQVPSGLCDWVAGVAGD